MPNFVSGWCFLKREQHKDCDVQSYIKNSYRSIINLPFRDDDKRKHVSTCQNSEYITSTYYITNKTLEGCFTLFKRTLEGKSSRAEMVVSSNNIRGQNQV